MSQQRGHVRSKSTGVAASPGMRRSAGKTLAAPVVTDVKAVSKGLVKSTDVATTKLREIWHSISQLGVDSKLPESAITEIVGALDVLLSTVAQQHTEILKAVRLARDAAGAMSTTADPEENDTTTVDLDPNTHGKVRTAEERMTEQRKSGSSTPKLSQRKSSPRTSPKGSPKASRSPARSSPSTTSPKREGESHGGGDDAQDTATSTSSLDEEERKAKETLERIAAAREAEKASKATTLAPPSGRGHRRTESSPIVTIGEEDVEAGVDNTAGAATTGDDGRKMGDDGFLRSDPKMVSVVDAATEAMRKKMKKKSRDKFLKDCDALDEAARKEYMAKRAAEIQKNPWAAAVGKLRERSISDPPQTSAAT